MRRVFFPYAFVVTAWMVGCSFFSIPKPSTAQQEANKALIASYRLSLDHIIDNTPGDCPTVLAALKAEESHWELTWEKQGIARQSAVELQCH